MIRAVLTLASRDLRRSVASPSGHLLRSGFAVVFVAILAGYAAWLAQGAQTEEAMAASLRGGWEGTWRILYAFAAPVGFLLFLSGLMGDRDRRSQEAILLSGTSAGATLLALLAGRLAGAALVLAIAAPFFLLLLPFGGIDAGEIFCLSLLIAGRLAVVGALAAVVFPWIRTFGAGLAIGWILIGAIWGIREVFHQSWIGILDGSFWLMRELHGAGSDPLDSLAYAAGSALLLVAASAAAGRRLAVAGNRVEIRSGLGRRLTFWRRPARRISSWFCSPEKTLPWRECRLDSRPFFAVVLTLWILACLAFPVIGHRLSGEEAAGIVAMAFFTLVLIQIVTLSLSVSRDFRRGYFVSMLASNVEPGELLSARCRGSFLRAALLMIPAWIAGVLVVSPGDSGLLTWVRILAGFLLASWVAAEVTLYVGSLLRGRVSSIAGSVLLAIVPAGMALLLVAAPISPLAPLGFLIVWLGAAKLRAITEARFADSILRRSR